MEELVVTDERRPAASLSADLRSSTAADSAALLRSIPGANVSRNGALTGIAHYRGMYGDRVAVHLDGSAAPAGGPNAMDAPLSYAPGHLLADLRVHRGIAPVSASQEGIGGSVHAELDRGQFGDSGQAKLELALDTRYLGVNRGTSTALRGTAANDSHRLSALASHDEGEDSAYGDGTLHGTGYQRQRYDLSYGYRRDQHSALLFLGRNDTGNSGTPALPMDIDYIDTDLAGLNLATALGPVSLGARLAVSDVEHGMDNFSQRPASQPGRHRFTEAIGEQSSMSFSGSFDLLGGRTTVGADSSRRDHDATVTNPNNAAFEILNFNAVERDVRGLFAEWQGEFGATRWRGGLRHNRVDTGADEVAANGMMGMMGMAARRLADDFNSADRDLDFSYTDVVVGVSWQLARTTDLDVALARKHQAPSYQALYLWLPMQSTGGLADGRSYIGNLQLDEERAHEINLGLNWHSGSSWFRPQLYYRDVSDYVQGTPATVDVANRLSSMMSGRGALQFNNVAAEIYGFDADYGHDFGSGWRIEGGISYVRGRRTDERDNLYRIAPPNHRLALSYSRDNWRVSGESVLYARQDKVSNYNEEQESAGYGLLHLRGSYRFSERVGLSAGVENLLDKTYRDHLAGYNRVAGSDVAVAERLFGPGRNVYVALQLRL